MDQPIITILASTPENRGTLEHSRGKCTDISMRFCSENTQIHNFPVIKNKTLADSATLNTIMASKTVQNCDKSVSTKLLQHRIRVESATKIVGLQQKKF